MKKQQKKDSQEGLVKPISTARKEGLERWVSLLKQKADQRLKGPGLPGEGVDDKGYNTLMLDISDLSLISEVSDDMFTSKASGFVKGFVDRIKQGDGLRYKNHVGEELLEVGFKKFSRSLTKISQDGIIEWLKLCQQSGGSLHTTGGCLKKGLLHIAIDEELWNVALWLVDQGLDLHLKDFNGDTPLLKLIKNSRYSIGFDDFLPSEAFVLFDRLVDKGALLSEKNEAGENCLRKAIKELNWKWVLKIKEKEPRLLMENGLSLIEDYSAEDIRVWQEDWSKNTVSFRLDNQIESFFGQLIALVEHEQLSQIKTNVEKEPQKKTQKRL